MPWTPKQHRLFEAAAHNPAIAQKYGISRTKAASMASEGIKAPSINPIRRPTKGFSSKQRTGKSRSYYGP